MKQDIVLEELEERIYNARNSDEIDLVFELESFKEWYVENSRYIQGYMACWFELKSRIENVLWDIKNANDGLNEPRIKDLETILSKMHFFETILNNQHTVENSFGEL